MIHSWLNVTPGNPEQFFMALLNLKCVDIIGVPDGIRTHGLKISNFQLRYFPKSR